MIFLFNQLGKVTAASSTVAKLTLRGWGRGWWRGLISKPPNIPQLEFRMLLFILLGFICLETVLKCLGTLLCFKFLIFKDFEKSPN